MEREREKERERGGGGGGGGERERENLNFPSFLFVSFNSQVVLLLLSPPFDMFPGIFLFQ